MESTYSDIVELLNARIEWHRSQVEKLTNMVSDLSDEPEPEFEISETKVSKSPTKRTPEKVASKKTSSNGHAQGGERKEQIIGLLSTTEMSVREIAEQLGTHQNYVRTVKKAWEADDSQRSSKPRRVVTRTAK